MRDVEWLGYARAVAANDDVWCAYRGCGDAFGSAASVFKTADRFTPIGKPHVRRPDIPAKVDGSAGYGLDVEVPGMLYASIARCPVFGGSVASFDATETKKVPGVLDVMRVPSCVAVVGKNGWAAFAGRQKLVVRWNDGPNAAVFSQQLLETARGMVGSARVALHLGHVDAIGTGRSVSATYELPFLSHAPMEPQNATADVRPDGCDVWAPTQVQTRALDAAVRITGLPADKVNVPPRFSAAGSAADSTRITSTTPSTYRRRSANRLR